MTAEFFDNVPSAIKSGEITPAHVTDWLDLLDLSPEERERKWNATVTAEGALVQFQVVALHRLAKEAHEDAMESTPDEEPIPAQFLRDVPEPVYDDPLPDLAGEIKRRLGIIACVRRFGKPQDRIRDGRVEGIKVRCPNASHPDHDPSAWCNTEKNTWYCGRCEEGGDVIDFFAATRGINIKSYHRSKEFNTVITEMGNELGLHVIKRPGSLNYEMVDDKEVWPSPLPDAPEAEVAVEPRGLPEDVEYRPEGDPTTPPDPPEPVVPPSSEATEPVSITTDEMMRGVAFGDVGEDYDDSMLHGDPNAGIPSLDWRELPVANGSFLDRWMRYAEEYYPWIPSEYFLFCGLQAVGIASGHQLTSFTGGPLSGALMVAIIGPSGYGKSTAVGEMKRMFNRIPATKFDHTNGRGIKIIPSPASSEALIKSIYTEIEPNSSTTGAKEEVGVSAWLYEDEFATFVERAKRRGGGTLKTRLIQLYDFVKTKDFPEMVLEEFSLTSGRRVLHDTYFSAMFTTQTDSIRSMMESSDLVSGFLNRIVPVFGPQPIRRTIADAKVPTMPPMHDAAYTDLWRWCRQGKARELPFTPDSLYLLDSHPFLANIEKVANMDTLYARIFHLTCRLAFILAVNNNEIEVLPKYVTAACELGAKYLMQCFYILRGAVIATPTDDAGSRIVQFCERFYERHQRWPSSSNWQSDRSYSSFDSQTRLKALDTLYQEGRLVRVKLRNGKGTQKVYIVPQGEWIAFAEAHDKTFEMKDVYK